MNDSIAPTLFAVLQQHCADGEDAVLVSIIAGSGSTPRGTGAKMAIFADGSIQGTIGGGALEYRAQQMAKTVLTSHETQTIEFKLAPNQVADLGMVCGGDVELYFQFVKGNATTLALLEQIVKQQQENQDVWMLTKITAIGDWASQTSIGDHNLLQQYGQTGNLTNRTARFEHAGESYYLEPLQTAGYVYIFGGGHISKSLVPVLQPLGFRCIVVDDKSEFADPLRFPQAEAVQQVNFQDFSAKITITAADYLVIMTRGHTNDYDVLVQALQTSASYIGMIGSRTKLGTTKEKLLTDGFASEVFDRVHAPIGLAIQAVTPEEIAISIAAELIQVRVALQKEAVK